MVTGRVVVRPCRSRPSMCWLSLHPPGSTDALCSCDYETRPVKGTNGDPCSRSATAHHGAWRSRAVPRWDSEVPYASGSGPASTAP
jgi:hypothetical protein